MKINKAISKIMKQTGFTQIRMAHAIGKSKATDISSRLNHGNMSFDKAVEMLSVLGYEIVVQPITSGQRKEGAIVIDQLDEEEPK